jgi:hypothetical protein
MGEEGEEEGGVSSFLFSSFFFHYLYLIIYAKRYIEHLDHYWRTSR